MREHGLRRLDHEGRPARADTPCHTGWNRSAGEDAREPHARHDGPDG